MGGETSMGEGESPFRVTGPSNEVSVLRKIEFNDI